MIVAFIGEIEASGSVAASEPLPPARFSRSRQLEYLIGGATSCYRSGRVRVLIRIGSLRAAERNGYLVR